MYIYDEIDQRLVDERVVQFRDQTRRFLAGTLSEEEFKPLRLRNGLYIQRYAPMLRIAVPYGLLASRQLRVLAHITRICKQTRVDTAQVWRLRTSTQPAEKPWDFLARLAERRGSAAADLYASERLTEDELRRPPLD